MTMIVPIDEALEQENDTFQCYVNQKIDVKVLRDL